MAKRNARNNNDGQTYDDDRVVYVNVDYLISCPAVLKIFECVFLIAAMACMVQYEAHWVGYPARVIFFYVVVCLSWILIFVFFVLMICTLDRRMPQYDWVLCVVFTSVLDAVFLIAAGALMADEARRHRGLEWKDVASIKNIKEFHFDHLVAAVVLAFIAVLFMIIDIIVHLVKFCQERKRHRQYKENNQHL